jgi:hypothetical protein
MMTDMLQLSRMAIFVDDGCPSSLSIYNRIGVDYSEHVTVYVDLHTIAVVLAN